MGADDWIIVNKCIDTAYSLDAKKVISPVLYWSDQSHDNMLSEYIRTRRWSINKILAEMQARGAFCGGVVRSEAISICTGPLFVPNFDLLPEDEIRNLLAYDKPVLGITAADYDLSKASESVAIQFRDRFSAYPMKAFLLHADPVRNRAPYDELLCVDDDTPNLAENSMDLNDDRDVMDYEMWFCKMTEGFLDACAMLFKFMDTLENPFTCDTPLITYQTGEKRFRLYLYNRYEDRYDFSLVRSHGRVSSVDIVSSFPYLSVKFIDEALPAYDNAAEMARRSDRASMHCFQVKLRPGGASIIDVSL